MRDDERWVDLPPPTRGRRTAGPRRKGLVREVAETLLLALVMFLSVRTVGAAYEVEGRSMAPNLADHQRLFVARAAYAHLDLRGLVDLLPGRDRADGVVWYPFEPPGRGDIVVFGSPEDGDQPLIKRVVALPSEHVAFRRGAVFIDGVELEEPYIDGDITRCRNSRYCDLVVPEGTVYVLGDNRNDSTDSRAFGPVSVERIVGKAVVSFWPPGNAGPVPAPDYPAAPSSDS
jgi:signal peptidase I